MSEVESNKSVIGKDQETERKMNLSPFLAELGSFKSDLNSRDKIS